MKLSEVKYSDLKVGQKVKSDSTGNEGFVDGFYKTPIAKCLEHDNYHAFWIYVVWKNGNRSVHANCDFNKVTLI